MKNANVLRNLIRVLGKNIGALEKNQIMCCGVTISQWYAILELGQVKEISLIDLANLLNLDKSTTSRTVDGLVRNGLVERLIDADNRRYVKIKLTAAGRDAFEKINAVFDSYHQGILAAIPENKRVQVIESLELIIQALKHNSCCQSRE